MERKLIFFLCDVGFSVNVISCDVINIKSFREILYFQILTMRLIFNKAVLMC